MPRKTEDGLPTQVLGKDDMEMAASYDSSKVAEPGFTPAFLYVERGPGAGQLVPVKQGLLVIGRASSCELRIQHPSISRRHALVNRKGERFFLKDLGSQNGTFIHKDRLSGEKEVFPGDQLTLGNTVMKLRGPKEAHEPMDTSADVSAHGGQPANALKIALFTAAAFIGLAGALAFALATLNKSPSFEAVAERPAARPQSSSGPVPQTLADEPAARPVRPAVTVSAPAEEPVVEEILDVDPATLEEAPRERLAPPPPPIRTAAAAAVRPPPKPAPTRTVQRRPAPAPKTSSSKVALVVREDLDEAEADAEEEAPRASSGGSSKARGQIIATYASGNVATALRLARSASASDLERKLSDFQKAYNSAHQALSSREDGAALGHFSSALKLDQQLAPEQSSYGAEIRRQLSSLHTLSGFKALDEEDDQAAKEAFAAALQYDPANTRAKKQLAALGGGAAKAPAPAARASSIDDAFGDEEPAAKVVPASAPAPAKKADPKSSIDEAFGDE